MAFYPKDISCITGKLSNYDVTTYAQNCTGKVV